MVGQVWLIETVDADISSLPCDIFVAVVTNNEYGSAEGGAAAFSINLRSKGAIEAGGGSRRAGGAIRAGQERQ